MERRNNHDQRSKPTSPISRFSLKGKRQEARRKKENKNYYVDRYETRYFILIVSILFLCIFDAYFTFKILQHGGEELNPFLAKLIFDKPYLTLILKYVITACALVILIVHKNFYILRVVRITYIIYSVFIIYCLLILYEMVIYFQL